LLLYVCPDKIIVVDNMNICCKRTQSYPNNMKKMVGFLLNKKEMSGDEEYYLSIQIILCDVRKSF
jgi:hypothetical protein